MEWCIYEWIVTNQPAYNNSAAEEDKDLQEYADACDAIDSIGAGNIPLFCSFSFHPSLHPSLLSLPSISASLYLSIPPLSPSIYLSPSPLSLPLSIYLSLPLYPPSISASLHLSFPLYLSLSPSSPQS